MANELEQAVRDHIADLRRCVVEAGKYKGFENLASEFRTAANDLEAALQQAQQPASFQQRVAPWMQECFGEAIAKDVQERGDRFLEESLELLQSHGYDRARVATLVDYVYGRPAGDPAQEVGGVMVTLAAYCLATGIDMHEAGETELARIWTKVETIRAKQVSKRGLHTPLPVPPEAQQPGIDLSKLPGSPAYPDARTDPFNTLMSQQPGAQAVAWVLQRKTEGHPNFAPGDFSWMDVHSDRDDCPEEDENWVPVAVYTAPPPLPEGVSEEDVDAGYAAFCAAWTQTKREQVAAILESYRARLAAKGGV